MPYLRYETEGTPCCGNGKLLVNAEQPQQRFGLIEWTCETCGATLFGETTAQGGSFLYFDDFRQLLPCCGRVQPRVIDPDLPDAGGVELSLFACPECQGHWMACFAHGHTHWEAISAADVETLLAADDRRTWLSDWVAQRIEW